MWSWDPAVVDAAKFVLQLIQSVLVWPLAVLVVGIYFLRRHRDAIDAVIRKIVRVGNKEWGIEMGAPPEQKVPRAFELPDGVDPKVARQLLDPETIKKMTFEVLYNRIFGTQWYALANLDGRGAPIPRDQFIGVFQAEVERLKSPEDNFDRWLQFLLSTNLVQARTDPGGVSYQITPHGREFLAYIKNTFPTGVPPRLF